MAGYRGSTCPACGETILTDHPHQHVTAINAAVLAAAVLLGLVVASTVLSPVAFALIVLAAAVVAGVTVTFLGTDGGNAA